MTLEEIIRMAREAGLHKMIQVKHVVDKVYEIPSEKLERFADLVAAHEAEKWKAENKRDYENWKMAAEKAAECEREACAKVCIQLGEDVINEPWDCAASIRARGET